MESDAKFNDLGSQSPGWPASGIFQHSREVYRLEPPECLETLLREGEAAFSRLRAHRSGALDLPAADRRRDLRLLVRYLTKKLELVWSERHLSPDDIELYDIDCVAILRGVAELAPRSGKRHFWTVYDRASFTAEAEREPRMFERRDDGFGEWRRLLPLNPPFELSDVELGHCLQKDGGAAVDELCAIWNEMASPRIPADHFFIYELGERGFFFPMDEPSAGSRNWGDLRFTSMFCGPYAIEFCHRVQEDDLEISENRCGQAITSHPTGSGLLFAECVRVLGIIRASREDLENHKACQP